MSTPKDLRSIYVTFLKEGEHGEEALRAAAEKMRQTTKMQGSAAYDKSNKPLAGRPWQWP